MLGAEQFCDHIDGDGEHDGGVVLGGDAAQGLQVPQLQQSLEAVGLRPKRHPHLQGRRAVHDNLRCVLEGPTCLPGQTFKSIVSDCVESNSVQR